MKGFKYVLVLNLLWGLLPNRAQANPYLTKTGDAPIPIRVATCAISGGFMHLYTALDNHLFDRCGLKPEFLLLHGAGVSMAALPSNELQFLYQLAKLGS